MKNTIIIFLLFLSSFVFSQNKATLIIDNRVKLTSSLEVETIIKYVTVNNHGNYITISGDKVEKMNYIIEIYFKDIIDFEIVSEDMQSFRYKLIYRGDVIYDNETVEYVHAIFEL